jgi:hypothetical protein
LKLGIILGFTLGDEIWTFSVKLFRRHLSPKILIAIFLQANPSSMDISCSLEQMLFHLFKGSTFLHKARTNEIAVVVIVL